jgi:UDP-galactopyranose mutase
MHTCDLNDVPKLSNNHKVLIKDAKDLSKEDLDNEKNVIFMGRLATYKYLDMWVAIKQAMNINNLL